MNTILPIISGVERTLMNEQQFHAAISSERKRTERSGRPFLLMLIDLGAVPSGNNYRKLTVEILHALSLSIRGTDIAGWYTNHSVLGIVFPEITAGIGKSIGSTMLARVNGILYRQLNFEQFNQLAISYYVFPEEWDHDVPQRPSHPNLYPDLSKRTDGKTLFSFLKRSIDIVGSALGLMLCWPLLLGVALAIKLSSKGPVFFRQKRIGLHGAPFTFLKFRSMADGSDSKLHELYVKQLIAGRAEPDSSNGNGQGVYKITCDPRVTPVGSFLRRTSLDELPQLINVLRGEMSLVGPRPAISYEVQAYQIWHRRRILEAKPGITGLWQVKGRSRIKFDEMVRLDVRYAMAKSIWLDLKILMLTPKAVFSGEGAY
jgi:lipopolysaccharide/colanic/teichoic acid biosynthesis glycosyltransferase